jgi:hypothetical protein
VRVTGYGDINDSASIQAVSAFKDFAAEALDGTAIAAALRISALNEGRWGEALEVQVENASKFSLLLAEDIASSASLTQLTLRDNQDVQVGSVLYLVEQVTGVVRSVIRDANADSGTITLLPGLTAETTNSTVNIPDDALVFSPDMKFQARTDLAAPVAVNIGSNALVSGAIRLTSVLNTRGEPLRVGDIINFSRGVSAQVVVRRFVERLMPSGDRAMLVEFAPPGLGSNFDSTRTRVYARDFDILVRVNGVVTETHSHLSLIDSHRRDYVNERLAPTSGASRFITAQEVAGTDGALVVNTAFGNLSGGNDGLSGNPVFGADDIIGSELSATGLHALDTLKGISILVIPGASRAAAKAAIAYCEKRQDLFFVMDLPETVADPVAYVSDPANVSASSYAAVYYPWILDDDPLTGGPVILPPSGAVAGIYALTDTTRGVHKAPAGVGNGRLKSATGVQRIITKAENDVLYQNKINVIRKYPEGILVWGVRTLSAESVWRYVNVRRLFIFLEQSIERGLQWAVFEPNDFPLWKSIQRNVSAFLRVQWEEGKLVGNTEDKAFFVRCDQTTNTPDTVNVGQVIVEIGVAPSKPAEFVVFRFKQFVGKTQ